MDFYNIGDEFQDIKNALEQITRAFPAD